MFRIRTSLLQATYGKVAAAICETAEGMCGRQPTVGACRSLFGEAPEWLMAQPGHGGTAWAGYQKPSLFRQPDHDVSDV